MKTTRTFALFRTLLPLTAVIFAAPSAHAAVKMIQAGADSRTEAGIGAPATVKQGPSSRSVDVSATPYIQSTSDSREDRYFYRVIDSSASAVRFASVSQADLIVRSSVSTDGAPGEFQFPAHGAASSTAFYTFSVDTTSELSLSYAAFASSQPSAYAYVSLDIVTIDPITHQPLSFLRQGLISGIDTVSYELASGSYGLSLTALSTGDIPARISANTESKASAIANVSFSISPVPEPSVAVLFALGGAGLGMLRLHRRGGLPKRAT